jgi:hypothetical protein
MFDNSMYANCILFFTTKVTYIHASKRFSYCQEQSEYKSGTAERPTRTKKTFTDSKSHWVVASSTSRIKKGGELAQLERMRLTVTGLNPKNHDKFCHSWALAA